MLPVRAPQHLGDYLAGVISLVRGAPTNTTTTSRSTHTASARNVTTNNTNSCRTIPRWVTARRRWRMAMPKCATQVVLPDVCGNHQNHCRLQYFGCLVAACAVDPP